jgi:protocatechuate 3,4-dioxygenase beta subunit
MRTVWLVVLFMMGLASGGLSQTLRGTVVMDGGRPVSGVVVTLVDASSREVGRALTNELGEYRLTAPRPGSYRVRTLRIGFQSLLTEPIVLVAGDDITRRLAVSTLVFSLDTVRAIGRNTCKVVAGDSTSVVAAIWDQVRSALIATQLTLATRTIQSTSISYNRMLDVRSRRIGSQMMDIRSEFVTQPWRSLSADALRKSGYVYTADDSSRIYHSPDLSVLLSDEFIEDHCLRIARDSDDRRLGIEFEPTPARRNTPEIRGTLWLDRKTNELQEMEHRYINRIRLDEERIAGGEMGFTRMRNGMWAISRWNIHMPVLSAVPVMSPTYAVLRYEVRLDSIKQTGGELVAAVTTGMRRDTLWVRPRLSLRGTVLDSLSGSPVRNAIVGLAGTIQVDTTDEAGRFTIGGVLPGRYSINVTTPSLDSLNTVDQRSVLFADSSMSLTIRVPNARMIAGSVCGKENTATRLGAGIILGSVMRSDSAPVANASIAAQWNEITLSSGGAGNRVREAQTRTDVRGVFRICGLPTATSYTVYAKTDSAEARPVSVRLAGDQLFGRADLVIERALSKTSIFTGTVVDTAGNPLANTDVMITDVPLSASTDAQGVFRIGDVPPGNHAVTVRKIGYGQMDAKVDFLAGTPTDHRIVLSRIVVLDSMLTEGKGIDPLMKLFDERRKIGLGHFVPKSEIVKWEALRLENLITQLPALNVLNGLWVEGKRATRSSCNSGMSLPRVIDRNSDLGRCVMREGIYYVPDVSDKQEGMPVGCFARVYLDNQLLNAGSPARGVSLRELPPPPGIEAVEWYASPTEMPMEFLARNSSCGVLVVHLRRKK